MNTITLNNQLQMPLRGFGVFQIPDLQECEDAVRHALKAGYRLIDTAACYENEQAVGRAVQRSGLSRGDVFLVSKVWIQDAGYDKTMRSFEKTLKNLQTDYLDLYLVHMPYGDYHGSWRAMEELYQAGRIRAIGVCNFLPDRLVDLVLTHSIVPAVNQIELHPFCQQRALRAVMKQYGIQPMAWAPFAQGQKQIFTHPILCAIGDKYGKKPAQVVLRWLLQENIVAIPKSVHAERIAENYAIEDFMLDRQDLKEICEMDCDAALLLDVASVEEANRLHQIHITQ